jgi:hypothetical protein
MTDIYGATSLPAVADDEFVDPLTYYIASYLQAALNAQLGQAWSRLAPGKDVVRRFYTANPEQVLFNESATPALFVWRPESEHSTEKVADDYHVTTSTLRAHWLQPHDSSLKRERRMQFAGPLSKAVHSALIEGRHPAWVVPGDADETSATRGSLLMTWAGLLRPPEVRSQTLPVTFQIDDGEPVTYQAIFFSIKCVEPLTRSRLARSGLNPTIVSGLELTVDQDGNEIESLIPTP